MTKKSERCPCCGHEQTIYAHNINKNTLSALQQLVGFYEREREECNINKDLKLTHNQRCNLPKLQYFGLIYKKGRSRWVPTQKGTAFVKGSVLSHTRTMTLGGVVLASAHPAWTDFQVEPKYAWEIDETAYMQVEVYKNQNTLFDHPTNAETNNNTQGYFQTSQGEKHLI